MVTPDLEISSRVITVTGRAPSPSIRLMFEPVTSILSIFWAGAWARATPDEAKTDATARAASVRWWPDERNATVMDSIPPDGSD